MSVRVSLDGVDLRSGGPWPLDERAQHYLLRVHRLKAGAPVTLFAQAGLEVDTRLTNDEDWRLVAEGPVRHGLTGSPVTVCYALPKGDKVDRVVRQLSELGVARLQLFSGERSVVKLTQERAHKKVQRWSRIADEAARQSGRADRLEIEGPTTLSVCLAALGQVTNLVFEPSAQASLDDVEWTCPVTVFVGPEGGFAPEELAALRDAGVRDVRLGPLVLRTETAAPVAAALVLDRIGALT